MEKQIKMLPLSTFEHLIPKNNKNLKQTTQEEREYVIKRFNGYRKLEHRAIWEQHHGAIPKGFEIHHKNGNKKDNKLDNLECLEWRKHRKIHRKKKGS